MGSNSVLLFKLMEKGVKNLGEDGCWLMVTTVNGRQCFKRLVGCRPSWQLVSQGSWILLIDHHYDCLLIGMTSLINDNDCFHWSRCSLDDSNVQSCRSPTIKMIGYWRSIIMGNDQDDMEPMVKMIDRHDCWSIMIDHQCWSWSRLMFIVNGHQWLCW